MLRYINQGIQKALRHNQARAPCQKGATDNKDDIETTAASRFKQRFDVLDSACIKQVPLSQPLPPRPSVVCEGNGVGSVAIPVSLRQREGKKGSHDGQHPYGTDLIRGAIVGAGIAICSSVHSYCSGRKAAASSRSSKLCPVSIYEQLQAPNSILNSLQQLIPRNPYGSSALSILPKQSSSLCKPATSSLVAKAERTAGDKVQSLRQQEYNKAKVKVNALTGLLGSIDKDYSGTDHFRALQAWEEEDFATAAQLWLRTVHKFGTPVAANRLGFCYQYGKGVNRDYQQACDYYQVAVAQGCGEAMYNLAVLQLKGHVTEQIDSMKLMNEAAVLDYPKAQTYLGSYHFHNDSKEAAVDYYRKAADSEDPDACYYLGVCYENGYGVAIPDDSMALTYYSKAALAGQSDAQYNLAVFYEEGFGGLEADKQQAIAWYRKAASQGSMAAKSRLRELGEASMRNSVSLPAIIRLLPATLTDASVRDIIRSFSHSHISPEPDCVNDNHLSSMSQASSLSSLSGGTKFFLPASDMDTEDVTTVSDWSESCSRQDFDNSMPMTRQLTVNKLSCSSQHHLLGQGHSQLSTAQSGGSLFRAESDGPQIVFA